VREASSPASPWWDRTTDRLAYAATSLGFERWARLGSVAVIPLLLSAGAGGVTPVYATLTVYVLLTALARRDRYVRGGDLVVAAAVIVGTQGEVAPYLLFLAVTVAGPASAGGLRAGLAAGTTLALVLLAVLGLHDRVEDLGMAGVLPVVLLLPLVGAVTASAARLLEDRTVAGREKLEEANRLLSALLELADDLPGGLDATTVAAAICAEVRALPGVAAVATFVEERGMLHAAASHEVHPGRLPTLGLDTARSLGDLVPRAAHELPVELRRACADHGCWLGARLGPETDPVGLLLVAVRRPAAIADVRPTLDRLGGDAAIALQNARLFDGTLARAADAARRRLAADLHDGVAQSLAHLKMELELLTMADGRRSSDAELTRLTGVADTALTDLRATIAGLRAEPTGDLANRLAQHVAAVTPRGGPRIHLDVVGVADLTPERADDALRIAQEALSNALRHAGATAVTVSLERDAVLTELVVEDDGHGRAHDSVRSGGGIGLRSMHERAERLGGVVSVRDRVGGGTVVTLRFPTRDGGEVPPSLPTLSARLRPSTHPPSEQP
jgi:signal transduction histidine kinase